MTDPEIRAANAQALLDNSLYKESFEDVRNKLIQQIELCDIKDDALRDKLMLSLQLLKRLKGVLNDHVNTGKLHGQRLERKTMFNRAGL